MIENAAALLQEYMHSLPELHECIDSKTITPFVYNVSHITDIEIAKTYNIIQNLN